MNKIITTEYDSVNYLDSEEMIVEYLSACLEDNNPDVLLLVFIKLYIVNQISSNKFTMYNLSVVKLVENDYQYEYHF